MTDDDLLHDLAIALQPALGADALQICSLQPLSGGAIQDMRALDVEVSGGPHAGTHRWVLRRDAQATIAESRSRLEEHALLEVVFRAGVTVPRPIACGAFPDGSAWSVVERLDGIGYGPKIVKSSELGGDRDALLHRLGQELATIHGIDVRNASLDFLCHDSAPVTVHVAARQALDRLCEALDDMRLARPILERGIRLARLQIDKIENASLPATLLHRDFRTGNLLIDESGLVAVLDWEFAGTGDPMSDLGWFCARCWRFSRPDLEAGGLGHRDAFYRGYTEAGRTIDADRVRWWESVAHLRWAVIALQQGERHASGRERSLALALTGRMADTLERDALDMLLDDDARSVRAEPLPARPQGVDRSTRHADDLPEDDLLAAAATELTSHLRPATDSLGLTVRMAIRAIHIARRERRSHRCIGEQWQQIRSLAGSMTPLELARDIRSGRHDDGRLDHALLTVANAQGAVVADN